MSNCMPLDFLIDYNKKYPNIWKYTEEFQSEKDLWDDSVCYFPIGASMGILQEFYNVPFPLLTKDAYIIYSEGKAIRTFFDEGSTFTFEASEKAYKDYDYVSSDFTLELI